MGSALTYLADAAVTTRHVDYPDWTGEKKSHIAAAACSMQGWRRSMEDAHFMSYNAEANVYVFGVFDGHGGSGVSRYSAKRLPELLFANENFKARAFDLALHETFMDIDMETQQDLVQEQLFELHLDSKKNLSPEDARKVYIHISFETLMELFLGDPSDPILGEPDPFRVFGEDYTLADPFLIPTVTAEAVAATASDSQEAAAGAAASVRKRKRRSQGAKGEEPLYTTEPHSVWGALASRLRADVAGDEKNVDQIIGELRGLVEEFMTQSHPILPIMHLKSVAGLGDSVWTEKEELLRDPLRLLFEGGLVDLFEPIPAEAYPQEPTSGKWIYRIHPVDFLAILNNNYLVENGPASQSFRRCVSEDQGCTANVCLVTLGDIPTIYCANAGDARSILVRRDRPVPLSIDHKPSLVGERRRVLHAGGKVIGKLDPRVQGDLNLSRAFGDWRHKQNADLPLELQMISPRPDITVTKLTGDDAFLVLGCDGIWERFSSADCASVVHAFATQPKTALTSPTSPGSPKPVQPAASATDSSCVVEIAEKLCNDCVRKPHEFEGLPIGVTIGCDNMTAIIVSLQDIVAALPKSDKLLSRAASSATVPSTMPVISYGAQVPDDWRPAASGRTSPNAGPKSGGSKKLPRKKRKIESSPQASQGADKEGEQEEEGGAKPVEVGVAADGTKNE